VRSHRHKERDGEMRWRLEKDDVDGFGSCIVDGPRKAAPTLQRL